MSLMIDIVVGEVYFTARGKTLRVTSHCDWRDEICGVVLDENDKVVDYFKTTYSRFCLALQS